MLRKLCATLFVATLVGAVFPQASEAQYFGRNKVQYEDFDFEVLETEHFDIYYYEEIAESARLAGQMAERWYARLSRLLDHELRGRQPLILYANHPHFQQTNALLGDVGEGTGGVTEVFKRRVVLPFAGTLRETDHVLGHELVHAFQFDITGSGTVGIMNGIPSALSMPLWFIEGMAEYLSVGPIDTHTAMWMRDAAQNELPRIEQLTNPSFFPYRYGQAVWSFVAGWYGDEVVGRVLKAARTSRDPYQAFYKVIGEGVNTLSDRWHRSIHDTYDWLADETERPETYGRLALSPDSGSGNINLAPVLSPDGSRIAFLSEKDMFSIELYLADANTGQIIKRLTKSALEPHLESLEFINSAGSFSPDGRTLVFSGVAEGQPILQFIDLETNRKRTTKFEDLGQILNPAYSPDGRQIAFSAIVGGWTDLYVYNIETEELSRITNDVFSDLHPAWSPDGSEIALVTDRFGGDSTLIRAGSYQIALVDPSTGFMVAGPSFDNAKNINPQYSPDGNSLYFVSDRDGISNLYRADLLSGDISQITNVLTGISGITKLSPAMSASSQMDRVAFSYYEDNKYSVYVVDDPEVLAGGPLNTAFTAAEVAVLPPVERITDDVVALLNDDQTGLVDQSGFANSDYSPTFSLDYVAQPYLVAGSDRFGTYIGGGAALFWSDMLGSRNLATALQIQGSFRDIAASVAYENRRTRWNWGVIAQQVPYVTGGISQFFRTNPDTGDRELVDDLIQYRQTSRAGGIFTSYAFNRARRAEFSVGFTNLTFGSEIRRSIFNTRTGETRSETIDLPNEEAINLGTTSAALVYDNSLFGLTGPVVGQRYRFEASPKVGTLQWVDFLADVRKYIMPVRPFTLAGRLLHLGRYGPDAEDSRLREQFIGYPSLVRGYDYNSFTIDECSVSSSSVFCGTQNQLFGSRLLVANLELRFPLLGALGIGDGFYSFLPVDMVFFTDAGLAWQSNTSDPLIDPTGTVDERAFFLGGDRDPVTSSGVGLRFNVFGFTIIEIDYVRAWTRGKSLWQFHFTPGF